uniref:Plantacyanin n=1 Tax=Oryza glumipatula TaxID=40148 RepID=A0A0D9ZCA6_9ORYZ
MAQGRGSAAGRRNAAMLAMVLLCVLLHGELAESAVYTVGDRGGWGFNSGGWLRGKRFRAGDVLVFKYSPSAHNVVAVNAAGYKSCSAPRGAKVYKSGSDRVTLARGTNYFICSFPGHCQAGMKIAVTAA